MTPSTPPPWLVSLHGGHSTDFCSHAGSTLREILDAAVARGMAVFGVTEHAPRSGVRYLYDDELAEGIGVDTLFDRFDRYGEAVRELQEAYAGRLTILRGFETEAVPPQRYGEIMAGLREKHGFEYVVGSVHHVADFTIDYSLELFREAEAACGGREALGLRYYEAVEALVRELEPEIVGHLDLIRKLAPDDTTLTSGVVKAAALRTLDAIAAYGGILDVNTAAWRKGLDTPYPAPWLIEAAAARGIPFCFGDDSHAAADVGAGIPEARDYLLEHGIAAITVLQPGPEGLERRIVRSNLNAPLWPLFADVLRFPFSQAGGNLHEQRPNRCGDL